MSLFTNRKVYAPLAAKLPDVRPRYVDICRFSKADEGGVAAQRAAHFNRYQEDPDIQALRAIPDVAWDPKTPEIGAQHGITWIRLSDLHPQLTADTPFAAVVIRGETVFASVMLSATVAHIEREDGSEENGYTWFVNSMLRHYRKADAVRWVDDPTRAARTKMSWATTMDTCQKLEMEMVFGGQSYDVGLKSSRLMLSVLTAVSSEDDSDRRAKLTGKRVAKLDRGGAAIPEHGMPKTYVHRKDQWGRPVKEDERGFIPDPDPKLIPVVQGLWTRAAAGDNYQVLHSLLVNYEAEGLLERRDHKDPGKTYADSKTEGARREAVGPFFSITNSEPDRAPSEDLIARYLDGEDPAELFEPEVRVYLSRVELMRTGRYFRRLRNDMEGIGTHGVNGYVPTMVDDDDTKGAFYVMSEPWPWPTVDGREVPRFGLSDKTCREVGARLLRELLANKEAGGVGGRNRADGLRRTLQTFGSWETAPDDESNAYEGEPTAWGVRARSQKSGKNTINVMYRRAAEGTGAWGYRPDAASGCLAELTASLARACELAAREAIAASEILPFAAVRVAGDDPSIGWADKVRRARGRRTEVVKEADGYRRLAALAEADNDVVGRDRWLSSAARADAQIQALDEEIVTLQERIDENARAGTDHDAEADLNVLAYLIVALENASRNRGLALERIGKLCDDVFTNWRFRPAEELLDWSCTALVPVTTGHTIEVPLRGSIRNLRTETGRKQRRLKGAAAYVFGEGRSVDEVAAFIGCNRWSLYHRYLKPWLRETALAPKLSCAVVDHPAQVVRQLVWMKANGQSALELPLALAFIEHIGDVYFDAEAVWGDTTVPDDTTWIQRGIDILNADEQTRTEGKTVEEMALLLGRSEWWVRQLVVPRTRQAGFRRPRFLEYADAARTRVRPISCPRGDHSATHVCLTPEVVVSGLGVLCRECHRVPIADALWNARLFPDVYFDQRWTVNPAKGRIADACQTHSY